MSNISAALPALALALAACGRVGPDHIKVSPGADLSQTAALIDRYVADGANPEAFAELASALDGVRDAQNREVADDAELRLLALAARLVDERRTAPIDEQVDALALTVWPALLVDPLTSPRGDAAAALAPDADESADAYVLRVCSEPLALECSARSATAAPALVVRALAVHRADVRMHQALTGYLHGGADDEHAWREVAYRWESLDRAMAIRQADGVLDSAPSKFRAERTSSMARELR